MTALGTSRARIADSEQQSRSQLSEKELESAWRELNLDPAKAYRAIWTLTSARPQAVALLKARVRPTAPIADPKKLDRWIGDLDNNRFAVRREAQRCIEDLGEAAAPRLRQALKGQLPLEVRKRVEGLLANCKSPLRDLRAVQVLETIGTPEAQQVLQILSKGVSEATLTQEAQAALARLAKRSASSL